MGLGKSNFYKKPEETKPIEQVKTVVEKKTFLETSWDDGGNLDIRIADLLTENNLKGTFYITINYVGKPDHLTWDQIKELDKRGFTIGSHTVNHPPDLKSCFEEELHLEIQNSKDMLENVLGHNVDTFAYPRGRADERVIAKVKESGYLTARGTGKPGSFDGSNKYYLPGTIHIFQRPEYEGKSVLGYAKETLDKFYWQGGYCNIFGHSLEIDRNNLWGDLEEILKYAGEFEKELK
jgi:peptidoglycan/xylan/chitin deacetylase (PgdA/CDA1 family)